MTSANYTQGYEEVQIISKLPRRQADAAGLLQFFIDRTDLKKLDAEELEFLAAGSEEAAGQAATLSHVVSGVACLISEDQTRDGTRSGSLQDHDIQRLLWFVSDQIEAIGKMAWIGSEADYELRRRAQASAATAKGVSRG
ncbi:hypothetical protein [Burkholderia multivorans]|uniref:hypothetical protein n=1 Tax=Burkholderia multivorans TaxID=87883 RepID=UPI001FC839AF|nr:hypothetical protein [Burkholderia multivorans]MCA8338469.1 hypothetical protein [Burkholderia multivorans]MDR8921038.1 hypothetical protein [Burkholderia multivorans]MDR8926914.1 hypothetical protein [Burkholderia multivorans]MDR8969506.1 hypothetical protein [Burkholderia multivorans]MDR8993782.1 hypothetical protein [Burkholderia multivorans]